MDPKTTAQLLTLLNPELARALLQSLEVIPKLERENKELRQTLEEKTVELNRVNDRRIEAEAERDRLHRENRAADSSIRHLKEKVEQLQNFVSHGDKLQIAELKATLDRVGREKLEVEEKVKILVAELGSWTRANQEIATLKGKVEKLEAGIAAYRKRSATAPVIMDLDDADAWEASLIDVDGKPTEETR